MVGYRRRRGERKQPVSEGRVIPDVLLRVQTEASDPATSAWISANAGSGKTYVLARRVIRLMLAGAQPARILCLTFTKAAAANMANQVFDTLAEWIALDDAALDRSLAQLEGRRPDAATRVRARRLFAAALDCPGGLKVQTIHAFCTGLLQQFPFEANVAARFSVLDERAEGELLSRLRLDVLLQAAAQPDTAVGQALAAAIASSADRAFLEVLDEALAKRDELTKWLAETDGIEAALSELSGSLGLEPGDTVDAIDAEIVDSPVLPRSEWLAGACLLATGQKQDSQLGDKLRDAAERAGSARLDAYLQVFFTDTWEPRKQLATRSLATRYPDLADRLSKERDRLTNLVRRRFGACARDRTAALLTIASAVIERYRAEKESRGVLDYADLIEKTVALMTNVDAAWVHYKLDLGIDHVLIDEAQDTSPQQWEIVKRLTAEFTAGEGAHAARRSIFAVGDEKQSIFSFQGAAPDQFAESRRHFERAHRDARLAFVRRDFKHSFRSGANVLSAVDKVFERRDVYASVTTDEGGIPPHIALPDARAGIVEIWPCIVAKRREAVEAWDAPFDEVSEFSPQVQLAERIAARARAAIGVGRRPGDILVLVRQRGPLFEAILRALKNARIAVAGADRLILTEHIAVMDLLALADALLLPSDDLALATVLKGPLFGFDEDLLFKLAWGRRASLRVALARARDNAVFAAASDKLERLGECAIHETPFDFYARLLGPDGGRRQFRTRLGREADDAIDEFLNLALAYEAQEPASLQGFVDWMRASAAPVKRDMDIARDEIRVMTVHGAKGLEAPMVILADTTTKPTGPRDPRLLPLAPLNGASGASSRFVWASIKDQDVAEMQRGRAEVRRANEDEYRRLLYVAMTRAAEHLIVCGAQGVNGKPAGCWYDLVSEALVPGAEESTEPHGVVWYWRPVPMPETRTAPVPRLDSGARPLPGWLERNVVPVPGSTIISPSRAVSDEVPMRPLAPRRGDREHTIERGLLLHRLLQSLPDLPPDRRLPAAREHVARYGLGLAEDERREIVASVLALLENPDFGALFGPGTYAEVPIVGRLSRPGRSPVLISGQVDRLVASQRGVLIADYKTNRPAPRELSQVPPAYVTQLGLYRAVLARLHPGRPIRAALVWTDVPELMELPESMLDGAVEAVLAAPDG
jgi:ATP-dependent helicase/nuclease subunit A